MDKQKTKKNNGILWGGLCTILIIVAMIFVSEYIGEREVIFPETAALAVGLFLAPELPWRTDYLRLLLCIVLCAVLGELIVLLVPTGLWIQLSLAYVLSQLIYLHSGTTLAPLISAIMLPVFIQTRGFVYPLAVLFLCTGLILIRALLVRKDIQKGTEYQAVPLPGKLQFQNALFRCIAVITLLYIALTFGVVFAVVPPLLVVFTELANPDHPARKRIASVIELVAICALAGTFSRYYLGNTLGLPFYIAVIPAVLIMILCMYLMKLYLPPAGAVLVLPFLLLSESSIMFYPAQVLIGTTVLVLVAWRLPQK